jgi:pyruvate-ferredoxin/flavodoxin oxidoreductase
MKKVMDGNEAAAHAAYAFTEISAIYPITPSSPMAEKTDEWAANGKTNIWGERVSLVEMQSEAGAVGALHGALEAGAYATSYTSAQGLLLMIPVMHRIAGCRLPAVLHVASRTVGTHAMSIFGDHSDVMNCRQTGFALLSSASVQEAMDMAAVAHLAAIKARMPFLHFFDGFRTSHEIQKIDVLDYEELAKLIDAKSMADFKAGALNPNHPTLRNTVQNPDVYFQSREANNTFYDTLPLVVDGCMRQINELTGRDYRLFNYYGAPDADRVIVAMGSVSGPIQEVVDHLNASGEKVGFVQVHLYRPFCKEHFLYTVPETVKTVSVLDRTKELGAPGEPLFQDVCAAYMNIPDAPSVIGGRYGLSSKDTTPEQIKAVFDNMKPQTPQSPFTIGITDDVTHLSLRESEPLPSDLNDAICCKFWGLGSDGTVGANKNSIKIIGENTDFHVQAYFEYDTKKSFGITKSHLRFGKSPIRSSYLVKNADFIACHNASYMDKYDIVSELKEGGVFLLNCNYSESELTDRLPGHVKRTLFEKGADVYIIDANKLSRELGLGDRANAVLQAAFFKLCEIIPVDDAIGHMKQAITATYRKKGDAVVAMNVKAVDAGITGVKKVEIPASWKDAEDAAPEGEQDDLPEFIRNILLPLNAQKGDLLPVSTLVRYSDGTMPVGTTAYEKRGIATMLPVWKHESCIQCNRCAFVCPHAVIRAYLLNEAETASAPAGFRSVPANGIKDGSYHFSLQFSDLDCTGCGSCVNVCPSKDKSLVMVPAHEKEYHREHWEYGLSIPEKNVFNRYTVKGSQFRTPLCEFSGACAGCGETPYAKLLTQLFGEKMYWANATGCTQAWGAAMPSIPYTKNRDGKGPAWSNSLFEDNAEFALGILLAEKQTRTGLKHMVLELSELLEKDVKSKEGQNVRRAIETWLEAFDDVDASQTASEALIAAMKAFQTSDPKCAAQLTEQILRNKDRLAKKTVWMYGGDGWAYDIGYGGLDHIIATGENINTFIVDTEVYSNTGGQSSKATPLGAIAQFQSSGKKSPKKNLGKQFMAYGNVYVASVSMGADPNQLVKAIAEAESFPGPSIVIAYTPCIAHGIKSGMENVQDVMKDAVATGYWPLYRYDPRKEKPFQLDYKRETKEYREFLQNETRYTALELSFPEEAKKLFAEASQSAAQTMEDYRKMEDRQ